MINETEIAKVTGELAALAAARKQMMRRMHYSTVRDILDKNGVSYDFIQDGFDFTGKFSQNYFYRWTSKWTSPAALYIQETVAGRRQYRSIGEALDALETILTDYLKSLKAA